MKLYVINLVRSQERLKRMATIFAAQSLCFTHIEAVDNFFLDDETYANVNAVNLWPQPLTRGEVACFLSHKKALERLIADQVPYGVIFEDDVLLGVGAQKILTSSDWLPKNAQIVKLETQGKKVWLGRPQTIEFKNFHLAALKSTHILTAAYLVSREAALQLVELMGQASAPFDHFLFNFSLNIVQKFSLFQLDPAIVIQAHLASTLDGERTIIQQRKRHQRSALQTARRETARLFHRGAIGLWGMKVNYFSDEQWKRVPFSGFHDAT